MDRSYQSLEALPIEHLQIVFVASSSCSEDDAAATTTTTTPSSATTVSAPACQQRPAPKKTSSLANGYANTAPPKVHDVKAKAKKSPGKMAATKRVMGKDKVRAKKVEVEKKTGVEEEVLDAPPDGWPLRRVISIEEDHLPHLLHGGPQPLLHQLSEEEDEVDDEEEEEALSDIETSVVMAANLSATPPFSHPLVPVSGEAAPARKSRFTRAKKTPLSPRGQPVGKENQQVRPQLWSFKYVLILTKTCYNPSLSLYICLCFQRAKEGALFAPDRLFKVVLVGNSSVGKTSLLRSFCEGRFHTSTTATVGEKRNIVITLCQRLF